MSSSFWWILETSNTKRCLTSKGSFLIKEISDHLPPKTKTFISEQMWHLWSCRVSVWPKKTASRPLHEMPTAKQTQSWILQSDPHPLGKKACSSTRMQTWSSAPLTHTDGLVGILCMFVQTKNVSWFQPASQPKYHSFQCHQ